MHLFLHLLRSSPSAAATTTGDGAFQFQPSQGGSFLFFSPFRPIAII
jgi:hypothetical protein